MDTILVIGLDHVVHKVVNQAIILREKYHINTVFLSRDFSGLSVKNCEMYGFRHVHEDTRLLASVQTLYSLIREYNPAHIECYLSNRSYLQLAQFVLLKTLRMPLIVWARGGELFKWKQFGFTKKITNYLYFQFSVHIIYKETYMPSIMSRLNITNRRRTFLPNTVSLKNTWRSEKKTTILFLNSFKPWRNVDKVADVMNEIVNVRKITHYRAKIVGDSEVGGRMNESENLKTLVAKYRLVDYVEVIPWTNEPERYYDEAMFFILPADLVFLNYSLLESMEQGVIPLVSDVDKDARQIIDNAVNGFIVCDNDTIEYVDIILDLDSNRDKSREISSNARKTVAEKYSLDFNASKLKNIYECAWRT